MVKLHCMMCLFLRLKKLSILVLCIGVVLGSCANTTPSIGTVHHSVFYDYSENLETPIITMAVFIELYSDPMRIKNITITSSDRDYSWVINNPTSIKDRNNILVMVGSSRLMGIPESGFPSGEYRCTYTDIANRTTEATFLVGTVTFPSEVDKQINSEKKLAIYDNSNNLLYYGKRNGLETNTNITNRFRSAKTAYEIRELTGTETAIIESKIEL